MPRTPRRPELLQGRVFRGSTAVARGVLTANELRGPAWRRLFRDIYACATVPLTHELRARAAAGLLVPGAVVSGASAAVLWGLTDLAGPEDDVELTVAPDRPRRVVAGVRVRRATLAPGEVAERRRVPVTTAAVTAVAVSGRGALDEAVVVLDRFVAVGAVDLTTIRSTAATTTGRGCRRARSAADLADGLAASPQETRLRLVLHRSTLPRPVAQYTVRDSAGFVARVDFAWPEHRLAVEYDGAWHAEPGQFAADRRRLNRLTAAGWRVVFVTVEDLRRPQHLVARIAAALAV